MFTRPRSHGGLSDSRGQIGDAMLSVCADCLPSRCETAQWHSGFLSASKRTFCSQNRTWKTWWEKQVKLRLWTRTDPQKTRGERLSSKLQEVCWSHRWRWFWFAGWLSSPPAVTWRTPSPSWTEPSWMGANWRSLRTAGGRFFTLTGLGLGIG